MCQNRKFLFISQRPTEYKYLVLKKKDINVLPSFISVYWYHKVYIITKYTTSLNILENKKKKKFMKQNLAEE